MIALDTNVLVRFLVEDDPEQHRRAVRLMERASVSGEPLWISEVVLCELVWVLRYAYKVKRRELTQALRSLSQARQLLISSKESVSSAIDSFSKGKGDFADYLIRECAFAHGASSVATFDRALLADEGFAVP